MGCQRIGNFALHARDRGDGSARTVQAWKSVLGSLQLDGHPARWRSLSTALMFSSKPASRMYPFFTIGHSTRSIPEFVELLREVQIELVVDVRTVPRSRTNPQFNQNTLQTTLFEFGIHYEHIAQLGGLRPKSSALPPSLNDFWRNASFHNYADYATSKEFKSGLKRLRELGHVR